MIGVTILGSTGSIGTNTLDVLRCHPDRYRVVGLSAHKDAAKLYKQMIEHQPEFVVMVDEQAAEELATLCHLGGLEEIEILSGSQGLMQIVRAQETDYVVASIVGAAGLLPTLAAVEAGKRVLLANKEALVMSGQLFMDAVARHRVDLLPLDSEHNAIFQGLSASAREDLVKGGVRRILLTASGGPFRQTSREDLAYVTPERACLHPNWSMGKKISVDSATLMNKGLEVIEACWLFHAKSSQIEVVLHPQSIIHSLVEYQDGSCLAQLSSPDMRVPIAHALAWPDRITSGASFLDLIAIKQLDFEPPDLNRFPCLRLCYQAYDAGGTAPAILNAANEMAVQAFLSHELAFTSIAKVIEETLAGVTAQTADKLEAILEADQQARAFAKEKLLNYKL